MHLLTCTLGEEEDEAFLKRLNEERYLEGQRD